MAGKVAIVTGASGNLGQAMIKKFLTAGFRVVGTVVPHDPVKLEFDEAGFEQVIVDLTSEENAGGFMQTVADKYRSVDAVVLTVGGFALGSIAETRTADILRQFKLNFETAYNVARPAFQQMMDQGSGRIFLIGARPGLDAKAAKGMVAYSLAKSLIFRLAELMNEEAKGLNIVTSVVVPSTIDTPQNRKSMPDADQGKWVRAEAIAEVISFYCSPAADSLREPVIKVFNNS